MVNVAKSAEKFTLMSLRRNKRLRQLLPSTKTVFVGGDLFFLIGVFLMNDDNCFQIVCADCGCLSIRIEEPLKALREAIVYCGDCGTSRGTVGALRDLAVQRYPEIAFLTSATRHHTNGHRADNRRYGNGLSKQYAELRRLRQQVEFAEWLARESNKPPATSRTRAG